MTEQELQIYNRASFAAINSDRKALALALREAKKYKIVQSHYGELPLQELIICHCAFIGWPMRLRPNGRYT